MEVETKLKWENRKRNRPKRTGKRQNYTRKMLHL